MPRTYPPKGVMPPQFQRAPADDRRKRFAAQNEQRAAAAVAVAERPPAEPEADGSGDEQFASALTELAAVFRNSGARKAEKKKALDAGIKQMADALAEFPDLAKDPTVWAAIEKLEDLQRVASGDDDGDLPPGTLRIHNEFVSDKVDWQWRHIKEWPPEYRPGGPKHGQPLPKNTCEWVYGMYVPETKPVNWNGIGTILFAETYYTGPKYFWDTYIYSRAATKAAHEHASYLFNGAAVPPTDVSIVGPVSQGVRARHQQLPGMPRPYIPGSGVGSLRGPRTEGEGGGEAGEETPA